MPSEARQKKNYGKIKYGTQKCSILGPQNLGSRGGPGPPGPPPKSAAGFIANLYTAGTFKWAHRYLGSCIVVLRSKTAHVEDWLCPINRTYFKSTWFTTETEINENKLN